MFTFYGEGWASMTEPKLNQDYEFAGVQPGANGDDFLLFNELETKSSFTISTEDVLWCKNFAHLLRLKIEGVRERFQKP